MAAHLDLRPIDRHNWRACTKLRVLPAQRAFVMEPSYYLALCCFGDAGWSPLGIYADGIMIGFLMWAIDEADGSGWLGGVMIDAGQQRRGYGTAAVQAALALLHRQHGLEHFALSYSPDNRVAARIYRKLGFEETGEMAEDELVARRSFGDAAAGKREA